ncbi:restriction endonuclease subunit S [Gracilibacillus sp. HCP3S3_G5_1]|uniref:restriction endonuclease subunit S n=1 Tax=unclassified Gracilibacillus TaxID=2625209 RepID=UPI003F8C6B9D
MLTKEMKDSRVEWIGEIPRNWDLKRMKYILKERKIKNDPIITEEILSLSVERGVFPYSEKTGGGNKAKEDLTAYKVTFPNDIVINSMNILAGAVGLSKYKGAVSPVYYTLYDGSGDIDINYYYYLFQTEAFQRSLLGLGNGIMMKESSTGKLNTIRMRIPMDKLSSVRLPLPPKNIQTKIVDFIKPKVDSVDKVIFETKQSIEELKKYKQSIITEAVTEGINSNVEMKRVDRKEIKFHPKHWTLSKIKYHLEIDPPKNEHFSKMPVEATFLPMNKLKNGFIINTEKDKTEKLESKYTYFAEGDIVIAKVRPSFENGNIAIAKNLLNKTGFGTSEIFVLRNKQQQIIQEFMFYFLRNDIFIQNGSASMTGVAGLQRISTKFIMNYPIAIPPLEEQLEIVNYLNYKIKQIDDLIIKKEKAIEELEIYKKSLIYEYVTGKKEV